jgi:hypothetical protein
MLRWCLLFRGAEQVKEILIRALITFAILASFALIAALAWLLPKFFLALFMYSQIGFLTWLVCDLVSYHRGTGG